MGDGCQNSGYCWGRLIGNEGDWHEKTFWCAENVAHLDLSSLVNVYKFKISPNSSLQTAHLLYMLCLNKKKKIKRKYIFFILKNTPQISTYESNLRYASLGFMLSPHNVMLGKVRCFPIILFSRAYMFWIVLFPRFWTVKLIFDPHWVLR